jgi:hypothetical protein
MLQQEEEVNCWIAMSTSWLSELSADWPFGVSVAAWWTTLEILSDDNSLAHAQVDLAAAHCGKSSILPSFVGVLTS